MVVVVIMEAGLIGKAVVRGRPMKGGRKGGRKGRPKGERPGLRVGYCIGLHSKQFLMLRNEIIRHLWVVPYLKKVCKPTVREKY